jgi:hypothetical protein
MERLIVVGTQRNLAAALGKSKINDMINGLGRIGTWPKFFWMRRSKTY